MAAPMKHFICRSSGYLFNKVAIISLTVPSVRRFHLSTSFLDASEFDPSTLDTVVCPLSKNPLRYDATASELINDELGVAYKIIDGIPNLIPQDARMIKQDKEDSTDNQTKNNEKTSP